MIDGFIINVNQSQNTILIIQGLLITCLAIQLQETLTLSAFFRYGNSVLQASGLAQHGTASVPIPDQAELWSPEGTGRPGQDFPFECNTSQSTLRTRAL